MNKTHPKIKSMSPQFVVTDLKRSLDFYTRELGFEIDFRYEDFYAGIIKGDYTIHLKSGSPTIEERTNRHENEHLDLVLSVEDIDSLFESMKSCAIIITQPLREMPYGREFYISDPDGYILGFIE
ncbi:MAG TPA: VOC family protein [Mucilaginibacter sp.]|jgi:predicted enzyme related to lactoylglutathione lyase